MSTERLLGSYILRVAIHRNRWCLTLHNLKTGDVQTFASFQAVLGHLEANATQPATAAGTTPKQR